MEDGFWSKVGPPDPTTGCRLWLGGYDSAGYGRAYYNGTPMTAHRLSWLLSQKNKAKARERLERSRARHLRACPHGCVEPTHVTVEPVKQGPRSITRKMKVGMLPEELRALRRKHVGMTQAKAAAACGADRTTYCRWENGHHVISPDLAARLRDRLG